MSPPLSAAPGLLASVRILAPSVPVGFILGSTRWSVLSPTLSALDPALSEMNEPLAPALARPELAVAMMSSVAYRSWLPPSCLSIDLPDSAMRQSAPEMFFSL